MQNEAMHIKAVVFHLEGTLVQAHNHDAATIKIPMPTPGAEAMVGYLRSKNIRLALFSHGSLTSVDKIMANLSFIEHFGLRYGHMPGTIADAPSEHQCD